MTGAGLEAEIAVIGGSGFERFLDDVERIDVDTPYGAPAASVSVGSVDGRSVAFLPRHGPRHEHPPHRVRYRANLWALRSLGVRRVLAPCATGSLRADVEPGHLVVLDQLIDRTWGRPDTYFDGPEVGHISFADPYCPELRAAALAAAPTVGVTAHDGGTVVVVQGPRFSTRAESAWFRSMGATVVNMTQHPEAALARELGLCYAGLAFVTDYDTGVEGRDDIAPVTMDEVFATLERNVAETRRLLLAVIPTVPAEAACACRSALDSGPLRGT